MKLSELNEKYELELDRVVSSVKKEKAKRVLIQLPDGLKQYGLEIVDFLKKECVGVEFSLWAGSCFGACDAPETDDDLVVQFGHAAWK